MADAAELIKTVANGLEILPRKVLMDLNKGALETLLKSSNSPEELQALETDLCTAVVLTIQSNEIDSKHLVTACDTAKSLLKNLRSSTISEVWMEVYEAVSLLFGRGKAKSGRVILRTLISRLPPDSVGAGIQHAVISNALDTFLTNNPPQSLVFNVVVIQQFLSDSISMEQLLEMISDALTRVGSPWVAHLEQFGVGKLAQNNLDTIFGTHRDQEQLQACVNSVMATLLAAAAHTDSPATIGHLLQTFMTKLKLSSVEPSSCEKADWVFVLRDILAAHPQSLDKFTVHIFPILYELDHASFVSLIREPLDSEESESALDCQILLRLAAINYLVKIGHVGDYLGLEETLESAFGDERYLGSFANEIICSLSQHKNAAIRIRVLSLWVISDKTSQGITSIALSHMRQVLPHIHGLHDSQLRNDAFPLIRQMIDRLTRGFERIDEAQVSRGVRAGQERDRCLEFSQWYMNYLFEELLPSASYQRHSFALMVLLHIIEHLCQEPSLPNLANRRSGGGSFPFAEILMMPFQPVLFDLLFDPFEDVRQLASRILRFYIRISTTTDLDNMELLLLSEHWPRKLLDEALTSGREQLHSPLFDNHVQNHRLTTDFAFELLQPSFWYNEIFIVGRLASQTNRADHADGLGRLIGLYFVLVTKGLDKLETGSYRSDGARGVGNLEVEMLRAMISLINNSFLGTTAGLNTPLENFPLHGSLYALRYSFADTKATQFHHQTPDMTENLAENVISVCQNVWAAVRDRLCVDAPECEMEDLEDSEALVGPKDMLSYSWRALRDSSLALHALLSTEMFSPGAQNRHLKYKMFERIGILCMEQMTRLRHRGAFSTVSRTFELFCRRCVESQLEAFDTLLRKLFETGKARMVSMDDKITRRSAGFPAFMSAILIAKDREFFNEAMKDFSHQALRFNFPILDEQKMSLPQVHYLNCLREVFLTAELRERSVLWLESGLALASECVVSKAWAIRNCGLMLLRAVVSRLSRTTKVQNGRNTKLPEEEARVPVEQSSKITTVALRLLAPNLKDGQNDVSEHPFKAKTTNDFLDLATYVISRNSWTRAIPGPETLCISINLISRISFEPRDTLMMQSVLARLFSHKAWLVRDQAARCYARLIDRASPNSPMTSILAACRDSVDHNETHGWLLAARYTFHKCVMQPGHRNFGTAVNLDRTKDELCNLKLRFANNETHPVVQAAFLDIVNDCLKFTLPDCLQNPLPHSDDSNSLAKIAISFVSHIRMGHHFPLLLRATTLSRWLLFLFVNRESSELHEKPQLVPDLHPEELTSTDPDALRHTIIELCDIDIVDNDGKCSLMQLYLAILKSGTCKDVVALAAQRLAILVGSFAKGNQKISKHLDFSWIYGWLDTHGSAPNLSRNMWTAMLCLRAAMLKNDYANGDLLVCTHQRCRFCRYLKLLRYAVDEEIELPTRNAGLDSLVCLEPILANELGSMSDSHRVHAIVALYDFLNDDDEDIREGATSLACTIYSAAAKLAMRKPLTSAVVGPKILLRLASNYNDNELRQVAVKRLFVPSLPQAVEAAHSEHRSVLFKEEKQNLYRDDLREAKTWARVLVTMLPLPLSGFRTATSEGLRYVLKHKILAERPLRTNVDIIVLCVRLVLMAEVLLKWHVDDELAQLRDGVRQICSGRLILPELDDLESTA